MKHNLGGNLGGNKGKSPGILEIPGLSLAEKERFELRDSRATWYYSTIVCANTSSVFGGLS